MPATGLSPEQLAAHRRQYDREVYRSTVPGVSKTAREKVARLVDAAELLRSYESRGGSGLASYAETVAGMERRLRERRKAFARYVQINRGDVRTALRYARALCSPFAAHFPHTTPAAAVRFLARVERGAMRRAS